MVKRYRFGLRIRMLGLKLLDRYRNWGWEKGIRKEIIIDIELKVSFKFYCFIFWFLRRVFRDVLRMKVREGGFWIERLGL